MLSANCRRLAALFLAAGLLAICGCGSSQPAATSGQGPKPTTERKPDVKDFFLTDEIQVPYILWGGDVATFLANGGETTQPGSTFDKQGLKLKLVRKEGDKFDAQVNDYKEGKSPFLRGTLSMLGQVSDDIGGDGRTQPVVFLQLTWSAGDHVVARSQLQRINDLPGKTIALQKGGPHVGMLNDILFTARLGWKDIKVVWTKDVTGPEGPAERFRKDPSIDACFVITPDMTALTGGFDKTGDGKEATVSGAHVLVSTQEMKRSIADVYACRKDFYDTHHEVVEKFAAGYLKATEEVIAIKKAGADSARYKSMLKLARERFGDDLKSDDDADGLISDAVFVGLPGNYAFFKDPGNLSGFAAKHKAALDLARDLGDAKVRREMFAADMDYARLKSLGELTAVVDPPQVERFVEAPVEKSTLYSFDVHFDGGKSNFPEEQYGKDFQRAVEQASLFGNAVISMKGHANPQEMNWQVRRLVIQRGLITERQGKFFRKDGSEFDMNNMKQLLDLIVKENLGNVQINVGGMTPPTMSINAYLTLLQKLSGDRAESVRRAVVDYAKKHGYRLDASQIKFAGLGGTEPVLMFPAEGDNEAGRINRRVEVRIVQVGAEAIKAEEFER